MLYDIKETSIRDIFVLFSNSEILMINELKTYCWNLCGSSNTD